MTDALLRNICEVGCLDYQPLARAGSCNRSLYAVCKVLVGRRVAHLTCLRLCAIRFRIVEDLLLDAENELDLLRSPTLYREEHERWAEQRLRAGPPPLRFQAWHSTIEKAIRIRALKGNMALGIRERHRYKRWQLRALRITLFPPGPPVRHKWLSR